jgi:hypothetical protein
MRLFIFDYFIDNHTSRPTGTWPVALIESIERSEKTTIPDCMKSQLASRCDDMTMEEKRTLILGRALKIRADRIL